MEKIFNILFILIGFYLFCAVFIKKLRCNWMGTRIQSGAQSNLGLGFLFLYSGLLELFTTFPFENLFSALFYVVVPIVGAWLLAFNGYKHDIKNYKSLCERNDT